MIYTYTQIYTHIYDIHTYIHACMCVCLFPSCTPGAHRGQKDASDPLELELQMFVGAGTQT